MACVKVHFDKGMSPKFAQINYISKLCLSSEDAFVITSVANLMEVKVL
jgi:hypothetical protein